MKKVLFSLAVLTAVFSSCSKDEKDPPIIGNFSISGQVAKNSARFSTWIKEDTLGVFVTSDGKPQVNLVYTPSEYASYDSRMAEFGYTAIASGTSVGDVVLNAASEVAGFKEGTHTIYAYYPYKASASDITAVPVPDITLQDPSTVGQKFLGNCSYKWVFAYAKKSVSEYSAATVDLGEFKTPVCMINTAALPFAEDADGRTLVKLNITADGTIAYKDATFNLETEKFNGEPASGIDYIMKEEISEGWFGVSTRNAAIFVINADIATAKNYNFTLTATLDNGDVYAVTVPAKQNSFTDWETKETTVLDYLNLDWGDKVFEKK